MVLAATAIPVAFRPLQQAAFRLFSIDAHDIVANIAGFVPVGIVLAALGPARAVMAAALLSVFAETSQLVMLYRFPTLTDVATNVLRTIGFKLGNSCGTTMARYGTTPLALNTWYYVAGVYNAEAKTMDVYLNGKLDNGFLLGPVEGMQKSSRRMSTPGGVASPICSASRARSMTCAFTRCR